MLVEIEYNEKGEITSVAGSGPAVSSGRIARPNHRIVALEVEEIRHERDFEGLRKVVEGYRVTGHPQKACLSRKSPSER
jgi:hypothetical protein